MKLIHETIADIAYLAGVYGYYSGNSRADMQTFIHLAEQFEKQYASIDWEDSDLDYMGEVENFAMQKLGLKKKLMLNYPEAFTEPWDNLEVERVSEDEGGSYPVYDKEDETPNDFWSVYAHQVEGGTMCAADVPTEQDANELVAMITRAVKSYKDNGYLQMYDNKSLQDEINKLLDELISNQDPKKFFHMQAESLKNSINRLFL